VGCPVVILESPVTIDGNRRSWVELTVRRTGRDTGGHHCEVYATSDDTVEHAGRWVASSAERIEQTVDVFAFLFEELGVGWTPR